jgi:hypothetical protein
VGKVQVSSPAACGGRGWGTATDANAAHSNPDADSTPHADADTCADCYTYAAAYPDSGTDAAFADF